MKRGDCCLLTKMCVVMSFGGLAGVVGAFFIETRVPWLIYTPLPHEIVGGLCAAAGIIGAWILWMAWEMR